MSDHDLPGTPVFDARDGRRGLRMNRLFMSLRNAQDRARFQADEAGYCRTFGLSADQERAILDRDWQKMVDLGGSIFYIYKLAMLDGHSMQYLGGVFTGLGEQEFLAKLKAGGQRNG